MACHADAATCAMIRGVKQGMLHDALSMVSHRIGQPCSSGGEGSSGGSGSKAGAHAREPAWQQQLEWELRYRGGFQPLMPWFKALQQEQQQQRDGGGGGSGLAIPWRAQDLELQRQLGDVL